MDVLDREPNAPTSASPEGGGLPALYQHTARAEWGLAILAWDRDGKRAFQFEDGQLRVFKRGYYELLEEVDRSVGDARAVIADLNRQLGRSENRREREKAGTGGKALLSFDDQVAIFSRLYPGGFQDEAWMADVRGGGDGRRLKRHRAPAIAEAAETLSVAELDRRIGEGDFAGVCEALAALFGGTDLVTSKRAKPLTTLGEEQQQRVATTLRDYLYGDDAFPLRHGRWLRTLRSVYGKISWQIGTVVAALVHPAEHVCVRPSAFREQAAWMAPRLELPPSPAADVYQRLLEMAQAVRGKLEEAGLAPQDLVDVYDFMWTTLRPAARSVLDEAKARDQAPG